MEKYTVTTPQATQHRRPRLVGGLIACLALVTAACTGTQSAGSDSGSGSSSSSGRTDLVVAISALPRDTTGELGIQQAAGLTNANLIRATAKPATGGNFAQDPYTFTGVLAKSYDVSADELTYTFHLRTDAKSAAGNLLTADDVIWSFQRHFKVTGGTYPAIYAPAITDVDNQVKKVDANTVTFTVAQAGYGLLLLSNLSGTGLVYDSTLLKAHVTADDPYATKWGGDNPNFGFGSYVVQSFTADQQLVMTSNPNYPLGEPKIKKITYRVVADPAVRASALRSGDADVAVGLAAADLSDLQKSGAVSKYKPTYKNSILTMSLLTTAAPFTDVNVRKALTYAIPYDQILENVYAGQGTKTKGRLDDEAPGYDGSGIPDNKYDPAKAKSMLAAAGFPNGVDITLSINSTTADVVASAIQIQSFAAAGGFKVNINQLSSAAFTEQRRAGTLQSQLEVIAATNASPAYQLRIFFEGNTLNRTKYVNQTYLDAITAASKEKDDKKAGVLYNTAEKILVNDQPSIWIVRPLPTVGYAKGLSGIEATSVTSFDASLLHW
jgi:peptide/nickel transport system substrate-binding protein